MTVHDMITHLLRFPKELPLHFTVENGDEYAIASTTYKLQESGDYVRIDFANITSHPEERV
jgi:hypothetical protein